MNLPGIPSGGVSVGASKPVRVHRHCLFVSVLAMLAASACSHSSSSIAARQGSPRTHEAWRHLVAGDAARALKGFDGALKLAPEDPFARFGRAAIAFEYGRTEAALDDAQLLLGAAAEPTATPATRWLAAASSGWFSSLIYESKTWQQRLDFLAKLPGRPLPWAARMELLQVADDAARRAGREDIVAQLANAAGCPTRAEQVGVAGRRAVLDLLAKFHRSGSPAFQVRLSGCHAQVAPPDELPGVLVVQTTIAVKTAGDYDVALDYQGIAAFRVDNGQWHHHGGADVWGPSRSAARTQLSVGAHAVELRLSTYGGGADYWLAAFPGSKDVPAASSQPPPEIARPIAAYTQLLMAGLQGQWNAGLLALDQLREQRRFGLGLVEVGRFTQAEPTKPDNITRDAARAAWRLAVEQDPKLVRARLLLAAVESMDGRPREATAQAQAARAQAPTWWPAALAAYDAFTTEGFDHHADQALNAGLHIVGLTPDAKPLNQPTGDAAWACPMLEAALRRARQRDQLQLVGAIHARQVQCDARDVGAAMRALETGDPATAAKLFAMAARHSVSPQWLAADWSRALAASGDVAGAIALTKTYTQAWPRETSFVLRLANLRALAGDAQAARDEVAATLRAFPSAADVRQAARALGVPLPIDGDRHDGLAVIAKFMQVKRRYDAPAVFVLDRMVERVFADGSRMVLTHNIVRVQSKDALDRWGEVNVPAGAEVLTLRTVKPDLSVREPEDIFGKDTISAPELEPGDFVEWETLETLEPSAAFAPGFLGQRFYFQSNEAPLEHSEYVVVYPRDTSIDYDLRANAPVPVKEISQDGLNILRFSARQVAQIFPERAAVPPLHWLPSVRIASGVGVAAWTGFLADRIATIARQTPEVLTTTKVVQREAGGEQANQRSLAAALVKWVTTNIEPEGTLDEPASYALARGRGNRLAVALALAKALKLKAEPVLVRPLPTEGADEPIKPQELMAFSETLLYFPDLMAKGAASGTFVDLRPRQAPFGYVPPELDGARALRVANSEPLVAHSLVADRRRVELQIAVAPDGKATVVGTEMLVGGPAVEWTEALLQIGPDVSKRRRRFEELYSSYHFPGAELQEVRFDVQADGVHLHYTLTVERFAMLTEEGMVLEPRFFLSQPGRRFFTEPQRSTTLLMGPDVPLELTAHIDWPSGYRVANAGEGLVAEPLGVRGPRFVEHRTIVQPTGGKRARVVIQRSHQSPLLRVPPETYKRLSDLRRVDIAEQETIRVLRSPPSAQ